MLNTINNWHAFYINSLVWYDSAKKKKKKKTKKKKKKKKSTEKKKKKPLTITTLFVSTLLRSYIVNMMCVDTRISVI
jgi:hypothetical protein